MKISYLLPNVIYIAWIFHLKRIPYFEHFFPQQYITLFGQRKIGKMSSRGTAKNMEKKFPENPDKTT